jgi:hypothetical protein
MNSLPAKRKLWKEPDRSVALDLGRPLLPTGNQSGGLVCDKLLSLWQPAGDTAQ